MDRSVWLPIILSPVIMAIGGLALTILIPETLEMRSHATSTHPPGSSTPTFSKRAQRYHCAAARAFDASTPWTRLRAGVQAALRLLGARDVKLLLPTATLAIPVATVTMSTALRYMPLRFGWTLAQAGMALGARTGLNMLVLLAFLPLLQRVLARKHRGDRRHVVVSLARVSTALLAAGQVLFAAAPTAVLALVGLGVLTLGTGAPSLCRAALVRLVVDVDDNNRDAVGRLFGLLALCEMVGYLAGGVGLGALYQVGMELGLGPDGSPRSGGEAWWLALVFYVAAFVYFWCAGMLWIVDAKDFGSEGDVESVHTGSSSGGSSRGAEEAHVLADGRVTRKCPSLENVTVAI